jgi:hypothetical protein
MKAKHFDLEKLITEEIAAWVEGEDEDQKFDRSEVIGLIAWYFAQTNKN